MYYEFTKLLYPGGNISYNMQVHINTGYQVNLEIFPHSHIFVTNFGRLAANWKIFVKQPRLRISELITKSTTELRTCMSQSLGGSHRKTFSKPLTGEWHFTSWPMQMIRTYLIKTVKLDRLESKVVEKRASGELVQEPWTERPFQVTFLTRKGFGPRHVDVICDFNCMFFHLFQAWHSWFDCWRWGDLPLPQQWWAGLATN